VPKDPRPAFRGPSLGPAEGHRLRGRDGFTLVEALAAFAILALLTLVAQRTLVMARTSLAAADARIEAERVARTLLDEPVARTVARGGSRSGVTDGRRWTVSAEPLALPATRPAAPAATVDPTATADPTGAANPAAGTDPATKGTAPAPATWRPLRVTIHVEVTPGRTLAVETVRLARATRD
jgi:type II secretory pathway pseudopilin PulG